MAGYSAPGTTALADLTDVDLTGAADGDTLAFVDADDEWTPQAPATEIVHKRQTTGSVAANLSTTITIVWPTPFPDANYSAVVAIEEAFGDLRDPRIVAKVAASINVSVTNVSAVNARTGTVHAMAIHD